MSVDRNHKESTKERKPHRNKFSQAMRHTNNKEEEEATKLRGGVGRDMGRLGGGGGTGNEVNAVLEHEILKQLKHFKRCKKNVKVCCIFTSVMDTEIKYNIHNHSKKKTIKKHWYKKDSSNIYRERALKREERF